MSHEMPSSENNSNQPVNVDPESVSQPNPNIDTENISNTEAPNGNNEHIDNNTQEKALSSEADSMFADLPDHAKELFAGAYESLYKVPIVNRLAAKLVISYKQFWLEHHQDKAEKPHETVLKEAPRIDKLKQHNDELRQKVEQETDFKKKTALSRQLFKNGKELSKLEKSRNKAQTKVEKRQNKINIYINDRNGIALKLIEHYDDKLAPISAELSNIEESETEAQLLVAELEILNEEKQIELDSKQQQLNTELDQLRQNFSDKEIDKLKLVYDINNEIALLKKEINEAKTESREILVEIQKKRDKVEKRAKPYRDRQKEFSDITDKTPITYSMPSRGAIEPNEEIYKTRSYPRNNAETGGGNVNGTARTSESSEKSRDLNSERVNNPNPKLSDLINAWNKYISDGRRKQNVAPARLDEDSRLNPDSHISLQSFKKWLLKRYNISRYNLMPDRAQPSEESIDRFIDRFN